MLTPTNLVWILNEDEDIADFKKKIMDTFSSHGFTTEISNISGGEHIKLDSKPIFNERSLSSLQAHIRLYHKAKKVMIQGSINAINTWVKHHNSISSIEIDMTDLVYVLNNKVSDEINGCDQTIGLNQSSKDTVVIPDNGSQEQNPLDPNNDISPKKAGVFNSVKDTISSLESSFVTFKNDVDNNMQTILKNLQDLITTEVFNDSNPTSKQFQTANQ